MCRMIMFQKLFVGQEPDNPELQKQREGSRIHSKIQWEANVEKTGVMCSLLLLPVSRRATAI